MKCILLGDRREKLLSTAEIILKHWGYRVIASANVEQIGHFLVDAPPDLVILGQGLLEKAGAAWQEPLARQVTQGPLPLAILADPEAARLVQLPHDELAFPLDIFQLFELIQRHLETTPRRNLRLRVQLPGMFYKDVESAQLTMAEVLSLSVHGLFIKTGCRVDSLDRLTVVIPLFGMRTEVEIEGKVLYRVNPGPENNYMQGVGIQFLDVPADTLLVIKDFLENRLLGEVSDTHDGPRDLDTSQLHMHGRDLSLKISRSDPPSF
jgi:Tfp pilus assembly protein PilZ